MKKGSSMKVSLVGLLLALAAWASTADAQTPPTATATPRPARRVVACYFHRTVRCPTCLKIGSSIDAALRVGLAAELQDGRLEWMMLDFQDPRNQAYTTAFRITGPTFILMDVQNGRITNWKPLPRVWSLVGDPNAFYQYVQTEVRGFLAVTAASTRPASAQ